MTTLYEKKETCQVCGATNTFTGIGSTNGFGSPDLDTRPPEMMRSTLRLQIRRCPACGYCAHSLADAPKEAKAIVQSAAYRAQLTHPDFPETANSFLCQALIQQNAGTMDQAGWAYVQAAWLCDDRNMSQSAQRCRVQAIAWFERCQVKGVTFAQDLGAEEAILADLCRRSEQFDRVAPLCKQGLAKNPVMVIQQILDYQIVLANKHDTACHRIEEATK